MSGPSTGGGGSGRRKAAPFAIPADAGNFYGAPKRRSTETRKSTCRVSACSGATTVMDERGPDGDAARVPEGGDLAAHFVLE